MTAARIAAEAVLGPIVWQEIACPLCGAGHASTLLELPWRPGEAPFRLARCRACGLGYLNPRPDEASIARFYHNDYEPYHRAEHRPRAAPAWRRYLERLVMGARYGVPGVPRGLGERLLAKLAGAWLDPGSDSLTALPYQGEGRLLEYGCGTGWYGHRMRGLGWNVIGMDISAYAAAQARRLFELPVIVGTLPHPAVPPESCDVITMGQVLEHVHRPHDVIRAAATALRPGGYLAVAVPNLDSWGFRAFGAAWWCLQLPIHLLHFTPATLRQLLEMNGLEVRTERQLRRPGWMRRSLAAGRQQGESGPPRWLQAVGKSRMAANLLTRWAVRTGQGDCLLMIAHRPDHAARKVA